jgi:glutathione S-transferase
MLRLYDYLPSGNAYKVRLLLTQLGIPFERVDVDILSGATRTPEFLAKNANGRIPLLEISPQERLAESNAILFYLSEGTTFLPKARWQRAKVLEWLFFEQYNHEPNIATVRFWLKFAGLNDERRAVLAQKRKLGYAALDVMEKHLAESPFFVADTYTIADIALYAYTHVAHEGDFDLSRYRAVQEWMDRIRAQPGHVPITAG